MKVFENFTDDRLSKFCFYCGQATANVDHVPPKVFLDQPYPANLFTVNSCIECNEGNSLNEEYMAVWLECAFVDSCDINLFEREKIKNIVRRKPQIISRMSEKNLFGETIVMETGRVSETISKIAIGLANFELGCSDFSSINLFYKPFLQLSESEKTFFETGPVPTNLSFLPEIGSRLFMKIIEESDLQIQWECVQSNRFIYIVIPEADKVIVKFIIRDYLACYAELCHA